MIISNRESLLENDVEYKAKSLAPFSLSNYFFFYFCRILYFHFTFFSRFPSFPIHRHCYPLLRYFDHPQTFLLPYFHIHHYYNSCYCYCSYNFRHSTKVGIVMADFLSLKMSSFEKCILLLLLLLQHKNFFQDAAEFKITLW